VPVFAGTRRVGTIGLASGTPRTLSADDLPRLALVAALALQARKHEAQLTALRRLFDEVNSTLENALSLDRALRIPPTYRAIARAVGACLDATYCQIAIRDSANALTIRASGGRRPPKAATAAWPLRGLARCAEALRERRAVVLTFSQGGGASQPERMALFTATTRTGVILPFFAGPRTHGVLIIGEERQHRCQPLSPERVAILELVAGRIAHILRMSRQAQYERLAERRRERRTTRERQRIAREVHDEVGQSLTGLLVQIRVAIANGSAGPEELRVLERATGQALDGARSLAYGFRHLERGVGPLEHARSFTETLLRTAGCTLSWSEDRADVKVAGRTKREIAHVVKESVSNIVRHAQATVVRVRVEYPDGLIRVSIHDNGIGFTPQEVTARKDGRGLGLIGNAERLARLGGLFDVRSSPRGGTQVLIEARRQ
jgi:signal transduction histidine kinase